MVKFVLSAFADEYSPNFDEQIEGLQKNGIGMIEIRGVDGTNISKLTEEEMLAAKAKLDKAGIKVSSIGSPIGKVKVTDDFDEHIEVYKNCIKAAKIFGTNRMRIFSFYIPEGMTREECRPEVMKRLSKMLEIAKAEGIILCHENENGIYGESPEYCLDIQKEFNGEIKLIFDPANFILDGYVSFPTAYDMLGDKIFYMHIKDADKQEGICPAGMGKGGIFEILSGLNANRDGDLILTLEPHLKVFNGLSALGTNENTKIVNAYASNKEAFTAAADALKAIVAKIN